MAEVVKKKYKLIKGSHYVGREEQPVGSIVELTDDQAHNFRDKVVPHEPEAEKVAEKSAVTAPAAVKAAPSEAESANRGPKVDPGRADGKRS